MAAFAPHLILGVTVMKNPLSLVIIGALGSFATPASADTSNGFGVGTAAFVGQYLDIYGTVETNGAAYRMGQNSSGTYTNWSDTVPVNFEQCSLLAPGTCTASQGGTSDPSYNLTASSNYANLSWPTTGLAGAVAQADLATGKIGVTGTTGYYQTAYGVAEYRDVLTFNIAGANAATVTNIVVKLQLDGSLFTPDAPAGTPSLGTRYAQVDEQFGFGTANGRVTFRQTGANLSYGSPQTLDQFVTQSGWTSYSWDTISPGLTEFTGVYALTGTSETLGIRNYLNGFSQSIGSVLYGSTSSLSFVLPTNVTFTSASGKFLTSGGSTASAVPEPATWGMMIVGFGLVGSAMRRRQATRVSALS